MPPHSRLKCIENDTLAPPFPTFFHFGEFPASAYFIFFVSCGTSSSTAIISKSPHTHYSPPLCSLHTTPALHVPAPTTTGVVGTSKDVLARSPAAPWRGAASFTFLSPLHITAHPRGPVLAVAQCVFACFPAAPSSTAILCKSILSKSPPTHTTPRPFVVFIQHLLFMYQRQLLLVWWV